MKSQIGGIKFMVRFGGIKFMARFGGIKFMARFVGIKFMARFLPSYFHIMDTLSGIPPVIYLIFNKTIRNDCKCYMRALFGIKSGGNGIIMATPAAGHLFVHTNRWNTCPNGLTAPFSHTTQNIRQNNGRMCQR